ncbi:hypothetical protein QE152_g4971 [Popillia japonica]|uniref:Uncharacterized protein n=1 Tax=Popillia japonica TaxID=7064 RepID=A0AAW1MRE3_POPJA
MWITCLARTQYYIKDQLEQCGSHVENEEYIGLLLNGLPKEYNTIRIQMKVTGLENITMEDLRTGLKAQEEELNLMEIGNQLEVAWHVFPKEVQKNGKLMANETQVLHVGYVTNKDTMHVTVTTELTKIQTKRMKTGRNNPGRGVHLSKTTNLRTKKEMSG